MSNEILFTMLPTNSKITCVLSLVDLRKCKMYTYLGTVVLLSEASQSRNGY